MKKPSPRKNARRYDTDVEAKGSNSIGSRVSDNLSNRIKAVMPLLGVDKNSEVVLIAIVLLLSQAENIVEMYDKAGVVKKDVKALKAFMALPLSPEEIEFKRRQYPEKLTGALAKYYKKTMEKLMEIETRVRALEQTQRGKALETIPTELPPLSVDLELI